MSQTRQDSSDPAQMTAPQTKDEQLDRNLRYKSI